MIRPETDEQREIRMTVRALLGRAQPLATTRRAESEGTAAFDSALWTHLSQELGVTALLAPVEVGGLGLSLDDASVILEEVGRACYHGPMLEAAVIVPLLLELADQSVTTDWHDIVSDQRIATIAGLGGSRATRARTSVTATDVASGEWRLDGVAYAVPHGLIAHVLYVVADAPQGPGVWAVDVDAAGHDRTALTTLDLTRQASQHTFDASPARLVMSPVAAIEGLPLLSALAAVALSAEQIGASAHLLETTIDYTRTRYQFGRAIGSFQAVKHRVVDMSVAAEGAKAASGSARTSADTFRQDPTTAHRDELLRLAAIAGAHCSDAVVDIAGAALQLHGGLGMSWEHDVHLYLRRAKSSQALFGSPADHRRSLRRLLDLEPVPV